MEITASQRKWAEETKAEQQRMRTNPDRYPHDRDLHETILRTWERDSPRMWAELEALGIQEALAYVCQQRMWAEADLLARGGFDPADARAEAFRAHLMLEPETEPVEATPDEPTEEMDELTRWLWGEPRQRVMEIRDGERVSEAEDMYPDEDDETKSRER